MIRVSLAATLLATALSGPTLAQGYQPYRGFFPNPFYDGRTGFGAPTQYCQKLCSTDYSPCDPPEFKHADGRCTNPVPGRM